MKTLFVSPHTDDAALSCGGRIVALRDAGEDVAIVTIFSGSGPGDALTPYQRDALGFGFRPEAAGRAGPTEPAEPAEPTEPAEAPSPFEAMELRRREDRAYARFVGAIARHLDVPDAVFRDYQGDDQLIGTPRPDDPAPVDRLRDAIREIRPDRVCFPLAVGSHVDHRLARRAGMELLAAGDVAPEIVRFYEDFPYSRNVGFTGLADLDAEFAAALPASLTLEPELVAIDATIDRKIAGLECYRSQLGNLFGGNDPMAAAVRERAAFLGGSAAAERYWRPVPRTRTAASS